MYFARGPSGGRARGVAEARQVVLELLDAAAGDVAGAGGGDVDGRDAAGVDGRRGGRAGAGADGVVEDRHGRSGGVAGAEGVERRRSRTFSVAVAEAPAPPLMIGSMSVPSRMTTLGAGE